MSEAHKPETAQELTDLIELVDISFHELHANREEIEGVDENRGVNINMVPMISDDSLHLAAMVTADLDRPEFRLRLRVEVVYKAEREIEMPDDDVMAEFLGGTTLLTVAPYIREGVGSLSARIGFESPVFPLIRPSTLIPDYGDPDEEDPDGE